MSSQEPNLAADHANESATVGVSNAVHGAVSSFTIAAIIQLQQSAEILTSSGSERTGIPCYGYLALSGRMQNEPGIASTL